MAKEPFHLEFLKAELKARKIKNSRYSLRAFSRALKMDPAALSRLFSGKQELSPKACPQILRSMKASTEDCEKFIASVLAQKEATEFNSILDKLELEKLEIRPKYLPRELYDRLSNRYHAAILDLFDRPDFRPDPTWIANSVGTTVIHVEWIISVLVRAGLVRKEGTALYRGAEAAPEIGDRLPASGRVRIDRRRLSEAQSRLEHFLAVLAKDFAPADSEESCTVSAQLILRD